MKKHRSLYFIYFILLCLSSEKALANECGEWFDNFTSPVCTNAKYIFWTGALLTAGLYISRNDTSHQVRTKFVKNRPFGIWGKAGEEVGWGYPNALYILGGLILNTKKSRQAAEHMAESSLYTALVTLGLKSSIVEERPDGSDSDSFPSGHSATAFVFASVVTAQNGIIWGGLAHILALFIASSRINDDKHYLHDVVAGMTIGASYGWGVYFNHQKFKKPYWIGFRPTKNLDGGTMLFTYNY